MEHIIVLSNDQRINEDIKEKVKSIVERALDRFSSAIRKVEIRFLDSNGPKGGVDTQCTIKVTHVEPGRLVIKGKGVSVLQATHIASGRARSALSRRIGKLKSYRA